jgi:hypothetical protein
MTRGLHPWPTFSKHMGGQSHAAMAPRAAFLTHRVISLSHETDISCHDHCAGTGIVVMCDWTPREAGALIFVA